MLISWYRAASGVRALRPASSGRERTMDQHGQSHDRLIPAPSQTTRRAVVGWTAKLAAGALAAAIPAGRFVQTARADDDDVVILTAAGAQVSARPGSAAARSAVAEAVAARGAARVQAAAALAEADSDEGAIAQGAAAVAVAAPDQGAIAQSASAVASASSQDDVVETPQAAPRQRRAPLLQPLAEAAEAVEVAGSAEAVEAVDAAPAAAVVATRSRRSPDRARRRRWRERSAVASRAGSLPSAGVGQLERVRCPRSSRSHRRSRLLARSSCGIAARQLRLPRSSSATTDGRLRKTAKRTRLACTPAGFLMTEVLECPCPARISTVAEIPSVPMRSLCRESLVPD